MLKPMIKVHHPRGFTLVESIVLIIIGMLVLGIAIPKFISATNLRRAKEVTLILNRLFDAQYTYHHKHKTFTADIDSLPISRSDLDSKWFRYEVVYAAKDTFFIRAVVKRPFGLATTQDWAAISSARIRTISSPQTLGKYAVEWMAMMKNDDAKFYRRHLSGDVEYEPD
mgnify:CR=1 FL=1